VLAQLTSGGVMGKPLGSTLMLEPLLAENPNDTPLASQFAHASQTLADRLLMLGPSTRPLPACSAAWPSLHESRTQSLTTIGLRANTLSGFGERHLS
jgi:hypothetical protein